MLWGIMKAEGGEKSRKLEKELHVGYVLSFGLLVEVKVAKAEICFDGSSCGHKQKSKTEKIGFGALLYTIYDVEKSTGHYRLDYRLSSVRNPIHGANLAYAHFQFH